MKRNLKIKTQNGIVSKVSINTHLNSLRRNVQVIDLNDKDFKKQYPKSPEEICMKALRREFRHRV